MAQEVNAQAMGFEHAMNSDLYGVPNESSTAELTRQRLYPTWETYARVTHKADRMGARGLCGWAWKSKVHWELAEGCLRQKGGPC